MRYIMLACAVALGLSVFPFPIGYYTFLRILVLIGSICAVVHEYKMDDSINFFVVLFGIIAILFNPIIPIYLGSKIIWIIIDLLVAVIFIREFLILGKN